MSSPDRGVTLLELIVVLVVLALAASVAAPALRRQAEPRRSGLEAVLLGAREAAARRGETIHLTISESGAWRMVGAASPGEAPIQGGRVDPFPGLPFTLIVTPVGSCGFDVRSTAADSAVRLDPMSCTLLD